MGDEQESGRDQDDPGDAEIDLEPSVRTRLGTV